MQSKRSSDSCWTVRTYLSVAHATWLLCHTMPCLLSSCRCKCTCNNTSILFSIYVVAAMSFARSLVRSLLFSPSFFFYYFPFLSILVIILSLSLFPNEEWNGVFYFSHSFHLLFSLVSFSLFCHCLCNSAEYFNIHFNYHLLLSRWLHSCLCVFFFSFLVSVQHLWAFVLYAFHISFGLQFIFHSQSHSIACAHPFARSLALCLSISDFFSSTIFSHPQTKAKDTRTQTDRRREREHRTFSFQDDPYHTLNTVCLARFYHLSLSLCVWLYCLKLSLSSSSSSSLAPIIVMCFLWMTALNE